MHTGVLSAHLNGRVQGQHGLVVRKGCRLPAQGHSRAQPGTAGHSRAQGCHNHVVVSPQTGGRDSPPTWIPPGPLT
jgi:hypothetical protein